MSLALACDLRLASDQASFIESFVRIGLCVDWGGAYYLPRLVGQAKAMELCWTAEPVGAHEALRLGLVNRVIAHDRFADDVRTLARQLAQAPQTSLRRAKAVLRATSANSLEQTLAAEIEAQAACWNSHDSTEGVQAFAAKRPPVFGAEPAARSAHRFE
jgi:2-(1,2-epoxy-1,2-dihydrophenyl)acetyl-CoA isomerase